jgi:DNA-binding MarR family transcriptional regulator
MNRYEFEFLSYIAEHNGEEYNQRVISDEICISGTQVKNSYEKALSEGNIIERKTDKIIVEITPSGLEALEPYRVKRAVILAA